MKHLVAAALVASGPQVARAADRQPVAGADIGARAASIARNGTRIQHGRATGLKRETPGARSGLSMKLDAITPANSSSNA